jgi:hypothetical protein
MQSPNHESVGSYSFGDPNNAPISVKKNGVDGESHSNGMNGAAWIEQKTFPGRKRVPAQQSA